MYILSDGTQVSEDAPINSEGQRVAHKSFWGEFIMMGSAHGSDKPYSVGHVPHMPLGKGRYPL